jgi:hypothetical protein
MPLAVYEDALAFLERSGVTEARILGGEPTEHPDFAHFVTLALARGFKVTLFTGGPAAVAGEAGEAAKAAAAAAEFLSEIPPSDVTVILNTAIPGRDSPGLIRGQRRLCRLLGERVELGLTLSSLAHGPDFLLDLIEREGLSRWVRLGVAHPIWGGGNTSLRLGSVRMLGKTVEAFIDRVQKAGVTVDFDCGFTPCMFSEGFLTDHPALLQEIGTRCNPVLDILPEGRVIACYALGAAGSVRLTESSHRDGLLAVFEQGLDRLLPMGAYRECALCDHRRVGRCTGGCRARRAGRLRPVGMHPLEDERGNALP